MAQQLGTSAIFMCDLGSVPRIHRVAHKIYNSSSRDLCRNQSCTWCIYICAGKTHKIIINKSKKKKISLHIIILVRLTCLSTFTNFPIMLWSSVSDVAALATYGSFLRKKHNSIRLLHPFSLCKVILSWETMHMGAWFSHMLTKGVILTHLGLWITCLPSLQEDMKTDRKLWWRRLCCVEVYQVSNNA